jgi:hypothetical protein
MTDLLLTSVLGLALGVAQGRDIQPGSSLMWMVITLLAYGSITLVRSTSSYGSERHIYLQQESPVSDLLCAVTGQAMPCHADLSQAVCEAMSCAKLPGAHS